MKSNVIFVLWRSKQFGVTLFISNLEKNIVFNTLSYQKRKSEVCNMGYFILSKKRKWVLPLLRKIEF